ncbi:MAG: VWA domain-containing protein [Acidobacteriota bacterium]
MPSNLSSTPTPARPSTSPSPRPLREAFLRRPMLSLLAAALMLTLWSPSPAEADLPGFSKDQKERMAELEKEYQQWLTYVQVLITEEEFYAFVNLKKDYQRDAFIARFWKERDPYPDTTRNELKDRWEDMRSLADELGGDNDERARYLLLNGVPAQRWEVNCRTRLYPGELWYYSGSNNVPFQFFLYFYRRSGTGPFRVWYPQDGLDEIFDRNLISNDSQIDLDQIRRSCWDGELLARGIGWILAQDSLDFSNLLARIQKKPEPPTTEWVATFAAYSTDVDEGAATFEAPLEVDYLGREQSRIVVQGLFEVPTDQVGTTALADHSSYNFVLNGEVLAEETLFEAFRYKFDFPSSQITGDVIPLVFQRRLRPGDYQLVLRLEDLGSGSFQRVERTITVPPLDSPPPPPEPDDPESARLLREAAAAIRSGDTTIALVDPGDSLQTDLMRIETLTTGTDIAKVTFLLDNRPVLSKKRPPYSVELDLGDLPRTRTLRVEAYNANGEELASDELTLNAGGHRFSARFIEPRPERDYEDSLRAEVEVQHPDGTALERVELFLNETRLATLYQPPFVQPVLLPAGNEMAYLRAVAHLTDGNTTEELIFINAPEYLEAVDVQFVELYTSVLDRDQRPVDGLKEEDFAVFEDDTPQDLVRFERVDDLPFHAALLFDVSASMDESLDQARRAAVTFYEQTLEPKDRGALITFNDRPNLGVKFTNEVDDLAGGLAGLKAERGTALYDSLIFSLYYFNGIKGRKAVLLLSDGKDESSRFSYEDALEYARRAGVTLYTIGLADITRDSSSRRQLRELAEVTGGRAFLVDTAAELPAVYAAILEELRSQYLLAYQSNNTTGATDFREVKVELDQRGMEVKTLAGYYP